MSSLRFLTDLDPNDFETTAILRKTASAGRSLAELKGVSLSIPNQSILINSLTIQEAKDSSEIENIITTHDDLFRDTLFPDLDYNASTKEVRHYVQALMTGYSMVRESGLLTGRHIVGIQEVLEENSAGYRRLPGTALKDSQGNTVYTPPQDPNVITALMTDLERFINDDGILNADPLVKMAIIHHQFESIHPFYDGNGRTGRIINVLYLVQQGLLEAPVLYLSRYIVRTKQDYYRLLQEVRETNAWEGWILYMLTAVEETARQTISTISDIKAVLMDYKHRIRGQHKFYSQDLINHLFMHPYTKVDFVERDLHVTRLTASRYLESLTDAGFLQKHRVGRSNYYVNVGLHGILTRNG